MYSTSTSKLDATSPANNRTVSCAIDHVKPVPTVKISTTKKWATFEKSKG